MATEEEGKNVMESRIQVQLEVTHGMGTNIPMAYASPSETRQKSE